jgi:uncharacterized membrane protein YfcA
MITGSLLLLAGGGFLSGILAGFLGIGGGFVVVSLLVWLGYSPVQAIATSSLVIVISAISGSWQNWRMGCLDYKRVIHLGLPALVTAQIGVYLANRIPPYILLFAFGVFLITSIYLVEVRERLTTQGGNLQPKKINPVLARLGTGGITGVLTGLLGVGGGAILVPLQMLFLEEPIKVAIQTSLGVIVATAVSACVGHASEGNILFFHGFLLGTGSFLGAQISTRFLPKLPDYLVNQSFRFFLGIMSIFMFWQAWQIYRGV